ncbi:unannotated protein [freshwater metagenome]|uniref:Unannotated protein n=1 Tax=freshwater metagenome TaxID=449393 RepID=A0A6J7DVD6_9ZZZZ
MLVDNPDSIVHCRAGRRDVDLLAIDLDPTCVGLLHTRQDADECRLTCPVFTEETVHPTRANIERDVVVGDDAGEDLSDVSH